MDKPFQRVGAKSNAHVGRAFEDAARKYFFKKGISLTSNFKVDIGIEQSKKAHAFDLGCLEQMIIVECKAHKWTSSNNVPSAKLTVWNEAMYYFVTAPRGYRKIMFVLRDFSAKRGETLAQYYARTYKHLVPSDVELWEFDEETCTASQVCI
ncbi:hypothetical protein LZS94_18165 [Aliivibrio fischeri]|uniref:hypothetical protein n=1 Tax=Aliivibrio fischeri TaxID=668 RepID=UPI001F2EF642|nr:hypothetical protein [Aliivibrio fischeri]MCE7579444.1 hypothetical protein [Aliivibrio fischeri]MCE7591724.1 hypothetical protein [Aliivibrio fischeri]